MNPTICLVLLGLAASVQPVSFFSIVLEEWEAFKLEHGKKYGSDMEEQFRMKIFLENKHRIATHNQGYATGKKSFKLRMNEYGDMLHQEFVSVMNGYRHNLTAGLLGLQRDESATFIEPDDDVVMPKSVDWRGKGAVTDVKNQGTCGSCWAFSATGSLEGQTYRKTGKLTSLSEQNLVDCSRKYGNNGCEGGLMDFAFKYIKDNGGIDTEVSYPYEAKDDTCKYNPTESGAEDVGYVDIRKGSEKALKKAVATVGPISVAIDASHETFQFYHKGVYEEPDCSPEVLDHGVLAVGYGTSEDGKDYWLVKNSWGKSWGMSGYIWMARNEDNMCGIATSASYPLV